MTNKKYFKMIEDGMKGLLSNWNDSLNEDYPFSKSFDEILFDLQKWSDSIDKNNITYRELLIRTNKQEGNLEVDNDYTTKHLTVEEVFGDRKGWDDLLTEQTRIEYMDLL